jgi:hypothetical protein
MNNNNMTAEIAAIKTHSVCKADNEITEMSIEEPNEYLVQRAGVICEYVRKNRSGCYTSDILPPICSDRWNIHKNIDNVLACFSSTLAAALSAESKYIKIHKDFEALSSFVESEKFLIFDFLSENGLSGKFNEFVNLKKIRP